MDSNLSLKHCTDEESTLKEIPCKLKSSRYKGVVPQHNGRWGAQIYECHRRIWLGTFADEVEAAQVYDIAAQRFRGAEATTNFKPLRNSDPDGAAELSFIAAHTKADIVRMLRNNTYHEELKNNLQKRQLGRDFNAMKSANSNGCVFEFLFKKIVTPSDVGKLNRLVIPKHHAEKHFLIKKDDKISINFQDGEGKVWRFTYSYWFSSQSYVMTRGWKLFVKEKGVKEGDVVSFWSAFDGSGSNQYLIDIVHRPCQVARFVPTSIEERNHMHDQVTIRLFGVDICKAQANRHQECDERIGQKKKREGAEVTFPQETCKKKNCLRIT